MVAFFVILIKYITTHKTSISVDLRKAKRLKIVKVHFKNDF